MKRRLRICLAGFLVLSALVLIIFKLLWFDPNSKLSDLSFLESASREEVREVSHQILSWPWGNHHDACIYLDAVGNESSVEYLVNALEWVDDSGPGRLASCSLIHCFDALKKITGKEFNSRREWEEWHASR